MLTNFHKKLIDLLKTDDRLLDEGGELIAAATHRRARQLDHDLVRLLLSDDEIKAKFFEEIGGHWIFNANAFTNYVSQQRFPRQLLHPLPQQNRLEHWGQIPA